MNGPWVTISKQFRFESAHYLREYVGPCKRTHGHSYVLEVKVKKQIDPATGMVIDFSVLKDVVNQHIISQWDHRLLNEKMTVNPTVENMLVLVWQILEKHIVGLYELQMWETVSSYAILTATDMLEYYGRTK